MARSPKPKRLTSTWSIPTIRPPATATTDAPAPRANSAARCPMSTGGSVAIPSRSSATAAKTSAIARASPARAARTTNSATGISSQPPTTEAERARLAGMATIVAFHAHPDDEALATGGRLARLV